MQIQNMSFSQRTPPRWFGAGENLGLLTKTKLENEILRRSAPQNDITFLFCIHILAINRLRDERGLFVSLGQADFLGINFQDVLIELDSIVFEAEERPKDGVRLFCFEHHRDSRFFFAIIL